MKEIIKLNARILTQVGDHLPEGGLYIERDEQPDELNMVPDVLRREVCALREKLNQAIPDDFSYTLNMGTDSPDLRLEYRDGATTGFSKGHEWKNERSILEQIKEIDWDKERAEALSASRHFDAIIEAAKDLPVMIPGTKALQKHSREEVKAYIKEKRKDASKVHVLFCDGEDSLFDEDFPNMEAFRHALPDILPHMHQVVTVVADGKPLPVEKIEALKKAALKYLEEMPISHAKATGKYAYLMSMAAKYGDEGDESNE